MEYVTLRNGVKMPILGYGVYQVTKEDCEQCVLDALEAGAKAAAKAAEEGGDLSAVIAAACEGAAQGVEATKDMVPKFGKAAVFAAKAKGVPDQGAMAGLYMLQGLQRGIAAL